MHNRILKLPQALVTSAEKQSRFSDTVWWKTTKTNLFFTDKSLTIWKGHFFPLLSWRGQHYMRFCPDITLISGCSEIDASDPRTLATSWPLLTGSMVEVTAWWDKSECCQHSNKVCMSFYFQKHHDQVIASSLLPPLKQHPNWNVIFFIHAFPGF